MSIRYFFLSLCIITSINLSAQYNAKQLSAAITAKLNELTNDSVPGIAVGVVQNGKIVYKHYMGYANLSHDIKISEKTRFNIASNAKQFTALMILDLAFENKLSLEDDIRLYLPNLYPDVEEEIKIRHLINHSSGIRDYVELLSLRDEIWWKQMGLDNEDVIQLLEKQKELGFEPGSQYSYSNSGYIILAKIIEKVSEQQFTDYSKNFFFEMGMKETYFIERYMGTIPNRAEPYYDWGDNLWLKSPTITKVCGDGYLFTTLKDQLIYEQKLHQMTASDSLLQLSQKAIPNSEITKYGFGLELSKWSNRTAVHHSGATLGYNAQMVRLTDEKLSIVVLSNNGNLRSDRVADSVEAVFLSPKNLSEETKYDAEYEKALVDKGQPNILGHYMNEKGTLKRIQEEEGLVFWVNESGAKYQIDRESSSLYALNFDPKIKVYFKSNEMSLLQPNGESTIYIRVEIYQPKRTDLEGLEGEYFNEELEVSFDLKLNEKDQLILSISKDEGEIVNILTENKLVTESYKLKIEKDAFGRAHDILLTYDRAKNIRFRKQTNLRFQPKLELAEGSIQVSNISSANGEASDILLTRNDRNGNEIWYKRFGGKSYDRASSILSVDDGYLIIGSTSSYGNGNYDVFVIKTNEEGKQQWQNTFGGFFNEYGYMAEVTESGFLVKGTVQQCDSKDFLTANCTTSVYAIYIDQNGEKLSEEIREEIDHEN